MNMQVVDRGDNLLDEVALKLGKQRHTNVHK
jgi:hypothetical protein